MHVTTALGTPLRGVIPLIRYEGRFLAPPVPRFMAFVDPYAAGIWTNETGDVVMRAAPAGLYEIFACRDESEVAAALRGAPVREPVRVGFGGDSAAVAIVLR
jgi:hypothetical protein